MLNCGCSASRSVFHVKLWLLGKQEHVSCLIVVVGQAGACLVVVVGQARVCFTLNCGCMLSRSMFHVRLLL